MIIDYGFILFMLYCLEILVFVLYFRNVFLNIIISILFFIYGYVIPFTDITYLYYTDLTIFISKVLFALTICFTFYVIGLYIKDDSFKERLIRYRNEFAKGNPAVPIDFEQRLYRKHHKIIKKRNSILLIIGLLCLITLIILIGDIYLYNREEYLSYYNDINNKNLSVRLLSKEVTDEEIGNYYIKNELYENRLSSIQYSIFNEIVDAKDFRRDKDLSEYIKNYSELEGYYIDDNNKKVLDFDSVFNYRKFVGEDIYDNNLKRHWDYVNEGYITLFKNDYYASDNLKMINYYFNIENVDYIIIDSQKYSYKTMKFGVKDNVTFIDGKRIENVICPIEKYTISNFIFNNNTVEFVLKCPNELEQTGLIYIIYLNKI